MNELSAYKKYSFLFVLIFLMGFAQSLFANNANAGEWSYHISGAGSNATVYYSDDQGNHEVVIEIKSWGNDDDEIKLAKDQPDGVSDKRREALLAIFRRAYRTTENFLREAGVIEGEINNQQELQDVLTSTVRGLNSIGTASSVQ